MLIWRLALIKHLQITKAISLWKKNSLTSTKTMTRPSIPVNNIYVYKANFLQRRLGNSVLSRKMNNRKFVYKSHFLISLKRFWGFRAILEFYDYKSSHGSQHFFFLHSCRCLIFFKLKKKLTVEKKMMF